MHWNEYKSKIKTITQTNNDNNYKRTLLDAAIPGVNKLLIAGFNDNDPIGAGNAESLNSINTHGYRVERNDHTKYFLPKVYIKDYNVLIEEETFMTRIFLITLKSMKN